MALVAHYPLISNADDESGNSYDLIDIGTPTYGESIRGGSVVFDESSALRDDGTLTGVLDDISTGILSFWMRATGHPPGDDDHPFIAFSVCKTASGGTSNYSQVVIGPISSGNHTSRVAMEFQCRIDGVDSLQMQIIDRPGRFRDNQWHHVFIRIDGSRNTIYVDGVDQFDKISFVDGSATTSAMFNVNSANQTYIGQRAVAGLGNQYQFGGEISDLRVYDDPADAEPLEIMADTLNGTGPQWTGSQDGTGHQTSGLTFTEHVASTPEAGTPTDGELSKYKYRMHPIGYPSSDGVYHLATSMAPQNEDQTGQITAWQKTIDGGETWTDPVELIPRQSPFDATGASNGDKFMFPTGWVKIAGGRLFHVAALESASGLTRTLHALLAREVTADGPTGDVFRVTEEEYTPSTGASLIAYDDDLSPQVFDEISNRTHYGGSTNLNSSFDGVVEGGTGGDDAFLGRSVTPVFGGQFDSRIEWLRNSTGSVQEDRESYWYRIKVHGGPWSDIIETGIPNFPSTHHAARLSTNQIAMSGVSVTTHRDPLWLAFSDANTLTFDNANVYVLKSGSSAPTYAGSFKDQGYSYPWVDQVGNYAYVTVADGKETIRFYRVLIPGLTGDDSDITADSANIADIKSALDAIVAGTTVIRANDASGNAIATATALSATESELIEDISQVASTATQTESAVNSLNNLSSSDVTTALEAASNVSANVEQVAGQAASATGEVDFDGVGNTGGDATASNQNEIISKLTAANITVSSQVAGDGTITVYRGRDNSSTIGTQLVQTRSPYTANAFDSATGEFSYSQQGAAAVTAGTVAVSQSGNAVTATLTLTDTETAAMVANVSSTYEITLTAGGVKEVWSGKLIVRDEA